MPLADHARRELRGIAHGEMIAARDHFLPRIREQLLPAPLKPERIVALAEDREQRKIRQRPGESARNGRVDEAGAARIAHIVVKLSPAASVHPGEEDIAAGLIQAAADAERTARDA